MVVAGGSCRKLLACNVYVSAGGLRCHGPILLDLLKETQDRCSQILVKAQSSPVNKNDEVCVVVHAFSDVVYNRSSFHLAGSEGMLTSVVSDLVKNSQYRLFEAREKEKDSGKSSFDSTSKNVVHHPYVGLVDHVSVMPLDPRDHEDCGAKENGAAPHVDANGDNFVPNTAWGRVARRIGVSMTQSDAKTRVFYYGSADPHNTPLATVRRTKTNFFHSGGLDDQPASSSSSTNIGKAATANDRNDCFSLQKIKDVATVGAPSEFVENFNIRLTKNCTRNMAQSLTRWVRERDGGLPGVEALTLPYSDGKYETACNLLLPQIGSAEAIRQKVQEWVSILIEKHRRAADFKDEDGDTLDLDYFVEKSYRVGTTVNECLSVIDSVFQPRSKGELVLDKLSMDELNAKVRSNLEKCLRTAL